MTRVLLMLIFFVVIHSNGAIIAQDEAGIMASSRMDELVFQADIMRNATIPKHRKRAGDAFHQLFKDFLQDSLNNDVNNKDLSKFISIISPLDSSFNLITWQVEGDHVYRYYGFIQFEDGQWKELMDNQDGLGITYDLLDAQHWYGVLYYNMYTFLSGENTYYLLFGYDAKDQFSNRKVIEVLSFDESGNVILGAPVFVMNDAQRPDEQYRYAIEYEENAFVRLNYDPSLNKIVFDHLIPLGTMSPGNVESMVPDGSYSGFELVNGKWKFKDKLFHLTSEKPPGVGKPKEEKRDIFGRKRKK